MKKLNVIYILEISLLIFGKEVLGKPTSEESDHSRTLVFPIPIDSIIAFPTVTTVISAGLLSSTTPIPRKRSEDVEAEMPLPGEDCKTVIYSICEAEGKNCKKEDPLTICDGGQRNGTSVDIADEVTSCPGLCQKPSLKGGECLLDPNCCEEKFRNGREYLKCLIQD